MNILTIVYLGRAKILHKIIKYNFIENYDNKNKLDIEITQNVTYLSIFKENLENYTHSAINKLFT